MPRQLQAFHFHSHCRGTEAKCLWRSTSQQQTPRQQWDNKLSHRTRRQWQNHLQSSGIAGNFSQSLHFPKLTLMHGGKSKIWILRFALEGSCWGSLLPQTDAKKRVNKRGRLFTVTMKDYLQSLKRRLHVNHLWITYESLMTMWERAES